ncbi:MAG: hypothetical protein A2275_07210 [Bacteroidetes bacterium RIFOXYA12_FULL_35_11]|nr:MAG: hypothetical protein A2X01_03025 [Bacteroidetes bacterium GWF2_35_48]OFY72797.1 MAG: hypothetical protein A2275_07210 [Bacteroidetes bacterium RIFOXYA12_FULL_35_11]HBX52976.1 endonuclease [Bacteroidales bacterium]
MNEKKITGEIGEQHAVDHLRGKGYKILDLNWQCKHKEIDIIASNDKYLVIVEVKARTAPYLTEPEDAVTIKKQKFLIQAANEYIRIKNIDIETRFDIITVIFSGKTVLIDHIEDAFSPRVRNR